MLSSRGRPIKRKKPVDGTFSMPTEPMPSLDIMASASGVAENDADSEAGVEAEPPELDKMAMNSGGRKRTKSDRRISTNSDDKIDVILPVPKLEGFTERIVDMGEAKIRASTVRRKEQLIEKDSAGVVLLPDFCSKELVNSLEELEPCILTLSRILEFMDSAEFDRTAVGCYVRARVSDSQGSAHFMLFQIRALIQHLTDEFYVLRGTRISKRIRLEGIETEQNFDCVSDEPPTADEFQTWLEWIDLARQRGDRTHTMPTVGFVQRKAREIAEAMKPGKRVRTSSAKFTVSVPPVDSTTTTKSSLNKLSPEVRAPGPSSPKKPTFLQHSAKFDQLLHQIVQTKEDLQRCTLSRTRLIQFVNEPYFAHIAAGCFVRIGVRLRRRKSTEEVATIFKVAEVIGVVEGDQSYRVADTVTTNRHLTIRLPFEHPPCNFVYLERSIVSISNYCFTCDEFSEWKEKMEIGRNPLPMMRFVDGKERQLRSYFQGTTSPEVKSTNIGQFQRNLLQRTTNKEMGETLEDIVLNVDRLSPTGRSPEEDDDHFNGLKVIEVVEAVDAENRVLTVEPVGEPPVVVKRPRGRPRKTAAPLGVLEFLASRQTVNVPVVESNRTEIVTGLETLVRFSENYDEVLHELMSLNSVQMDGVSPDQDPALRYMVEHGLIANSLNCEKCRRNMVLKSDAYEAYKSDAHELMVWHCTNAKCSDRSRPIRIGSIFRQVHSDLAKALLITFHWSQEPAIRYVQNMVPSATWQLINVLARVCRELCVKYCELEAIDIYAEVDQQQDLEEATHEPWNNTAIRKENRKTFPYCSRTWEDRFRKRMQEDRRPIFGALMDEIVRLYPVSGGEDDEQHLNTRHLTSMATDSTDAQNTSHLKSQNLQPQQQLRAILEHHNYYDDIHQQPHYQQDIQAGELVVEEEMIDVCMVDRIRPSTVQLQPHLFPEAPEVKPSTRRPMTIRMGSTIASESKKHSRIAIMHPRVPETPEPVQEVVIRQSGGPGLFSPRIFTPPRALQSSVSYPTDLRFEIVPDLTEIESFSNKDPFEILETLEWLLSTAQSAEGRATDHLRRYGGGNITNETELEPVLEFLVRFGLIANSACCDHCGAQMHLRSRTDQKNMGIESFGLQWECVNHKQELHTSKGIRKGTMFGKAKMNPAHVLIVLFYWSEGLSTVQLKKKAAISPHLANEWSKFARQICKRFCEEEMNLRAPSYGDEKFLALAEAERIRIQKQKAGGKHLLVAEKAFRDRMMVLGTPVFNGLMECALKFHPLFWPMSE